MLIAIGTIGAGGIAISARRSPTKGSDVPKTWDELARDEYNNAGEPISARASELTKVGAPVAAFITTVLAAVGGWVSDAPPGHTIIAVAIVVAVAVGGLLYAFATDFRARAGVAVARYQSLCRHATAEAEANADVHAAAQAKVDKAAVRVEAAERREKKAEEAQGKAEEAREKAEQKLEKVRTDAENKIEEIRIDAEGKIAQAWIDAQKQIAEAQKAGAQTTAGE